MVLFLFSEFVKTVGDIFLQTRINYKDSNGHFEFPHFVHKKINMENSRK